MLLAIDIGNTSTAVGIFNKGDLVGNWRMETNRDPTADEMALLYREFFKTNSFKFDQIKGIVISNVVPSVEHAVVSMSRRCFDVDPMCVNHENAGVKIDYPNPAEIGADRLVNAAAAYDKFKSAVIVVDFGTATTFDYINDEGIYCGGSIAPGVKIANEALYQWTSKLPRVDVVRAEKAVTRSTVDAIQSGVYNGYVGLVKNILEKIKREVGTSPKVIATGGLASLMVADLAIETDKFLTLNGLRLIYDRLLNNLATTG